MSECWPYNRFDLLSDDYITDIYRSTVPFPRPVPKTKQISRTIGATKPIFDIWGDTVNEASRMDTTGGTLGSIQVSQKTVTVSLNEILVC